MPDIHSRSSRALSAAAVWLVGLCVNAGAATPPPAITMASHDDFAQVVFAFSHHVGFGLQRTGDTLQLHFTGAGPVPAANGDARNVKSVKGGANQATLAVAPGARILTSRKGNKIVVEVIGPRNSPPPPVTSPPPVAARPPVSASVTAPPQPPAMAAAIPPQRPAQPPEPAPPAPISATVEGPPAPPPDAPISIAAAADVPDGAMGTAAFLPFSSNVGAAAFRRSGAAWVVFDERHQIDLTALQDDPLFARGVVTVLTTATLLRLPLAEDRELRLAHVAGGWTITAPLSASPAAPIAVVAQPTRFELAAAEANSVVPVPDPDTGQNLLVGTLRGPPAGVPIARRVPAFVLEPTWLGVAVEPIADTVTLRTSPNGFVIGAGGEPLSPASDATRTLADAAFLTRRFDIPTGSPDMLLHRLQTQVAAAAEAPAQSRGQPRVAAATTMIALGMGVEAQSMLNLATSEDPRLTTDANVAGLAAIGATLGGRPAETEGITDPALDGSDEVALWRAIRTARAHEGSHEAASVFATTINLLLAYPAPLRAALLPLAVETMALGGAPDAADTVLARLKHDPSLDLARAIRLADKGNATDALARYDDVAAGRDRLEAARAASRATMLRLKTKLITPGEAAAALEGQFLNWRGDDRELDLRMQVASLRADTGEWRQAFSLLRETQALYPESAPAIQARMAQLMTTLISSPASTAISPLEMVALTEENAELVAGISSPQIAGLVADKLLALDLPLRAGPVLDRMMRAAPIGVSQATLGARLAALRLGEGDNAGAQAALANSNAPDLPGDLIERRSLISARLAARAGHLDRAKSILTDLATPAANGLLASLLTDAQDWRGAAMALADLADKTVPNDGALTPAQQDTILRLASALSRGGDTAGLRSLAMRYKSRIEPPRVDMFRLLTETPVNTVGDLPRSSSEIALAKAIPVGLNAIGIR